MCHAVPIFSSAGADGCCDFWEQQSGRLVLCGPTKTDLRHVPEFFHAESSSIFKIGVFPAATVKRWRKRDVG